MASVKLNLKQLGKTASLVGTKNSEFIIDRPLEKGGSGKGPMGGQVMLMGIGGCFASTLYAAGIARNMEIRDLEIMVTGHLSSNMPTRFESIDLDIISGTCDPPSEFQKLIKLAEKGCIAVNTIRAPVRFRSVLGNKKNTR